MPCRGYRLLADGIAHEISNSPAPRHGTQCLLHIHSSRSIRAFVANRPRSGLSFRTDLSSVERATRSRMDRKRHSQSIKMAISAGIGIFLAIIALRNAGIVVDNLATLAQLGDLGTPSALLAALGFFAMVALDRLRVPSAILISIITVTVLSSFIGLNTSRGIVSAPPSLSPTHMQLDIASAFELGLI